MFDSTVGNPSGPAAETRGIIMNLKEVSELRRRFRPEKSAVSRVYGCYVNGSSREIISYLDESLGNMPLEEAEKYLSLLKKSLSGALGKNLIDVVFSTAQVMDSDEHRLLSALRESELKDGEIRETFYRAVIDALDMGDNNYLILLAHDAYDVPHRGKDGEAGPGRSEEVFSYILCSVCPVKNCKMELGYFPGENEFHSCAAGQVVSAPELGFLFPAFDSRAANIYNALFYSRKADQIHQEFLDAVFRTEPPMSAAEQKEAFEEALSGALEEAYNLEVAQAVHGRLLEKIEAHKEDKEAEPLALSAGEIGGILRDCGVAEEKAEAFRSRCGEAFGGAALNPENLIDVKRFDVKTEHAAISIDPAYSYLVETRIIDGRKYLLIPAGMVMGYFIVAAEPAVHVLIKQVEEVSMGSISQAAMKQGLSIGVAVSVGIAMLRVLTGVSILWFLIPGYAVSLGLTFFVPQLFTGVAFDAGGVASGPMTATFLLPFAMGACDEVGGNLMTDAFGLVALVAMTPLVTIQLMGLAGRMRRKLAVEALRAEIAKADDCVLYYD